MRKADYVKKGLLAGLLAISVCMAFPLHSAKANPHYDRRSTVAEEELECVPSAGASEKTEKKVSPKAWKKKTDSAIMAAVWLYRGLLHGEWMFLNGREK